VIGTRRTGWLLTTTIGIMSASMPHLTQLPVEILEQIFLHLTDQEVIKMEAVWRATTDHR
jgi:hypothetical protein